MLGFCKKMGVGMNRLIRACIAVAFFLSAFWCFRSLPTFFAVYSEKPAIGDLATWLGAFGAVGAMSWAIFLANSETRRREHSEKVMAKVIASRLVPRLQHLNGELASVLAKLRVVDPSVGRKNLHMEAVPFLSFSSRFDVPLEEISLLAPLPKQTAFKLAYALSLMHRRYAEVFREMEESRENGTYDDPLSDAKAKEWIDHATVLFEQFTQIESECRVFAGIPTKR
jgi:hypothetical protein